MVTRIKKDLKIDITEEEINRRIDQIESLDIDADLRAFMLEAMDALISIDRIVGMKETTILRLRKIFNKKMEKKVTAKTDSGSADTSHLRGNNKDEVEPNSELYGEVSYLINHCAGLASFSSN